MSEPGVYIAHAAAHKTLADVLQVYLEAFGLGCKRSAANQDFTATQAAMEACTLLIIMDSHAFRAQQSNYEFTYAQSRRKPLIVVSIDQAVDEGRSSQWVRLVDFSQQRDWSHLLQCVQWLCT